MKVIIVGGGFAGINLAQSLAHDIKFQVTLVDKKDHHFFTPFLYQLTNGMLKPDEISFPFQKLFSGKENLKFHLGELVEVIPSENKIVLTNDILEYEYLILATGSVTRFLGHQNIAKKAFSLKTMENAITLKSHLGKQFETVHDSKESLKIVVAGGGCGGVEAAAMVAEILDDVRAKQKFPSLKPEIYLIEKADSLLPEMDLSSQQNAYNHLKESGVQILLNHFVENYSDDVVVLSSGEKIEKATLIWTAGIKATKFEGFLPEAYGTDDRLVVDDYNKVVGTYNVFAIGDMSIQKEPENFPDGYPQMASVAVQQGRNLAENFQLMAERKSLKEFVFKDTGTSVVTGNRSALTSFSKSGIHFYGKTAWYVWLFLHLMPMIQHGNRLRMLFRRLFGSFPKR